ncbi:5-bromo-4-chloroindolyl phosphate hydrolysis family protein [Blautia massiliensis (ex Durand et al. 2017)]|uniref:5-bromo-4-chloroindolyl phosphate hydrolysis family protein n=1 Tax=Blautia massiliensis (ex Durand et al. 2017) TaxID=1737424 RepID=UPI0024328903|nr:5-bromo-4-chloroindolyl phosphate hydrolysis family protein [Blautia massiliensis (ex Durand et al. 2017)]MDD6381484.1 5-bromo-4-chloroindolyl phosphate hydrolysis family protein [Lachnospiraceae bacterium]MDD6549720.1 5-bromo-4-chloroindolyl phosphate hydrolysis family protein [Blautia massiliensis (ex Durand et al. 2017)]
MGINEDIGRAADEIIDRITDAVKNGNYAHLSSDINQSMRRSMQYNPYMAKKSMQQVRDEKKHRTAFMRKVTNGGSLAASAAIFTFFTVINSSIAVIFGLIALIAGIAGSATISLIMIVGLCVFGVLDLFFIHFLRRAKKDQANNALFIKYQQLIGNKEYSTIQDLCIKTGEPKEKVIADLKTLMAAAMLPGASFDPEETTLILSDYARDQCKTLMQNTKERQAAEKELPQEAVEMIRKGNEYIARIHRANDLIPEESMSDKLQDLENIMKKIFEEVRRAPDKRNDLRKLMDYYLPTTLKLVEAYADMENQPETENITSMKTEIENSLDVINGACRKIFDAMFEDENWDITSDINVMKTMMKQDGLVEDESVLKSDN